jgi:hypothetical protein
MRYFAANGKWLGDFWGCTKYGKTGCPGKINILEGEAPEQVAGASAQARFERQRADYRAGLRATLASSLATGALVMATVFFVVAPINPLLASLGAAVAGVFCLFVVSRLPVEARYWDKGARGERKTASYLEPLLKRGFVILHDRELPGSKANIDHIAIGPTGIFVIETKYISGSIEVLNDRLYVSDHDRDAYVAQVYREAIGAQVALGDLLNVMRITVTPVLCIHGARTPLFDRAVGGVRLVSGRDLRKLANAESTLLSAEQVQEVAAFAEKRLRPLYPWEN